MIKLTIYFPLKIEFIYFSVGLNQNWAWTFMRFEPRGGGGAFPYVCLYHLPVNKPPFWHKSYTNDPIFTTVHAQWPEVICQGSFWPLLSYFWGPSQSFKGPAFLISLMVLIPISISPQNLRALVDFEGPQTILRATGPRVRFVLTPANDPQFQNLNFFVHFMRILKILSISS